ncbi:hypothetical protein HYV44_03645 [Candidatus Microgenomates bacterium]|nr:hypothetical protein [Candidatus Microgenomates bacterium]
MYPKQWSFFGKALAGDRLHHAYIFYGPGHQEKKDFILQLAALAQCAKPSEQKPCGECVNCQALVSKRRVDTFIIDQQENISIDTIREAQRFLGLTKTTGLKKILIINGFEKMRPEAHDTLLKIFEEPPVDTLILLAVENITNIPKTILSRCHSVYLPGLGLSIGDLSPEEIKTIWQECEIILGVKNFAKLELAFQTSELENPADRIKWWLIFLNSFLVVYHGGEQDNQIENIFLPLLEKNINHAKIYRAVEEIALLLSKVENTNTLTRLAIEDALLRV